MLELNPKVRSTTVLAVRRNGKLALAGDGQITQGSEILKTKARKVRSLYRGKILAGFAGSTADALTLFSRFEDKLEEHQGNLERSAVELARDWRTDKKLRHLEALLLVADVENTLLVSGNGDVIEPDDNVAAVGSGGSFATAAAMALLNHTDMSAFDVAMESMKIAAHICIYTNAEITLKELG